MYRYIEKYNYADTWRDADDIHYKNERHFRTLQKAITYAKEKFDFFFERDRNDFYYDTENEEYIYNVLGSYMPSISIKEVKFE